MRSVRLAISSQEAVRTIGAVRPVPGTRDVVLGKNEPSRPLMLERGWHWYGFDVVEGSGSFVLVVEDADTGRVLAVSPKVSTRDGFLSRRFRFEVR